ncbi:MAG: hypothetical protein M3Z24_12910 [Chloroflexota bacterium]|nr:hypothetical protein [Chloroflexota bacterium]
MKSTIHTSGRVSQTSSTIARFGWVLADAWTITRRDLTHWRLRPATMIV